MTHDSFEEVHVTLQDGRMLYWPKGDMSRLAPAAVCSIAARMVRLRAALKKDPLDMREMERLINEPIAFEDVFLSGDSLRVHNAIKELGEGNVVEAAAWGVSQTSVWAKHGTYSTCFALDLFSEEDQKEIKNGTMLSMTFGIKKS